MVPSRNVDREAHVADILLKSQAALEEVRHYYKFDRHTHVFPEKMYFLLSHCAHLLFSLWLTENESQAGTFRFSAHLDALVSELDFDALRYVDYKRRTLHADAYEEHLKNEPNWFKFWLRALQVQDGGRPLDGETFAQRVLAYVNDSKFLEGTVSKKRRKDLADFMKTDAVARLLHRSALILEEMISAVVLQFAGLDPQLHTTEQIAALICMLRQARLIIVNEVPACGPYVLSSSKGWGEPTLFRVHLGQTLGRLKVVPKRDGGGVACTYEWTSGSQSRTRSWAQATSALPHPYEEQLFRTWSQDPSEHLTNPGHPSDAKACWLVQKAEASRLRVIFRHIEAVQESLSGNPHCAGLLLDMTDISIDRHLRTEVSWLEWTYVGRLDQLLTKLNSAYREARILGGKNPGQEVIATMWPVRRPAGQRISQSELQQSRSLKAPTRPRSVKWTQKAPVENHLSQNEGTRAEQCPADTMANARIPQNADSDATQASIALSVPQTPQNQERADGTRPTDDTHGASKPNERSTPKSVGETQSSMPQENGPQSVDEYPAKKPSQGPRSRQHSRQMRSSSEPQQDGDRDKNMPARCEVGGLQLRQNLPKGRQSTDEPVSETTKSQEDEPGDSHSKPRVAKKVSDRALRQCIAQEAQSGPEEIREIKASELTNGAEVTEASAPSRQPSPEPYQTYFRKLAMKGTAASIAASNSQTSNARSVPAGLRPTTKPDQMNACRQLLTRLMKHHGASGDGQPLSRKRIQEDLGWKLSEVQHIMADIFGSRPFAAYRQKCSEGIIGDFLETWAHGCLDSQHTISARLTPQSV